MIREQELSTTANGKPPRNKSEAVRRALATGLTSPTAVVAYIREQFALEVSPNYVSVIKGSQKRAAQGGKSRMQARFQKVTGAEWDMIPRPRHKNSRLSVEDLRSLLGLAERAGGVEVLKEFLGELARAK